MTVKELGKLLSYWKNRLGLQPWTIELALANVLASSNAEAEIEINWETETARITILSPEIYRERGLLGDQNIERSIVHELLHIIFEPIDPEDRQSLEWKMFEQAIDRVAKAFIEK